jgi:hypothetical protein
MERKMLLGITERAEADVTDRVLATVEYSVDLAGNTGMRVKSFLLARVPPRWEVFIDQKNRRYD